MAHTNQRNRHKDLLQRQESVETLQRIDSFK